MWGGGSVVATRLTSNEVWPAASRRSLITSSVKPVLKYASSGSGLALSNGRTTIVAAGDAPVGEGRALSVVAVHSAAEKSAGKVQAVLA